MPRIVYSDGTAPGITRQKVANGWAYYRSDGERVTDRDEIDRLNAIGLPPAYRDAWFNPNPNGHIQAIGWDDKGRKQYRYHVGFREQQEAAKYEKTAEFGRSLPKLRKKVAADLATRALSKDRAVAAVVRLLDESNIRVGNEDYVAQNESYGATTLRTRHGKVTGDTLKLQFKAKSGKMCDMKVTDKSLARFVKACQDLDEQHLFAYLGEDGEAHPVSSSDVNAYIKAATGGDFSAKNFRTWGASLLAFEALAGAKGTLTLKQLLEPVTAKLGNTPAIARKSYVHPDVIDLVKQDQAMFRRALRLPRATGELSREERGLIAFLERNVVPAAKAEAREAVQVAA